MNCPLIPPLEQLIQPLRKRFRYHFLGERRTNCKEKVHNSVYCSINCHGAHVNSAARVVFHTAVVMDTRPHPFSGAESSAST